MTNNRYKQLAIRREDKEFTIKSTDKETLRKWFYLLTLGRKLDERHPTTSSRPLAGHIMPPMQATTGYSWPSGRSLTGRLTTFSLITVTCLR